MFVQIHTLTGYSGVLLNRDDTGLAKRLDYGGVSRIRASSQFVKRRIRTAAGPFALSGLGEVSVRSRLTFRVKVAEAALDEVVAALPGCDRGVLEAAVVEATVLLMDAVYKPSEKAKKNRADLLKKVKAGEATVWDQLDRDEVNVLSGSEIAYLRGIVVDIVRQNPTVDGASEAMTAFLKEGSHGKNLKVLGSSCSLDIAMGGRMSTSDAISQIDAALHVGHAFSVHAHGSETDFFTAVDDLNPVGTGHVGETEISAPLLYGYDVVDFRQLLHNIAGLDNAREVAAELVGRVVMLLSNQVVGAKKGGTAPYSSADFVLVEVGDDQPRTLSEAFRKSVSPTLEAAVGAVSSYVIGKDRMYGFEGRRFVASLVPHGLQDVEECSVREIASRVASLLSKE